MNTRAITAKRPIDEIIDKIRSIRSTITEKIIAQKPNQNTSSGFQPRTQSFSVNSNQNLNNTETTESISPTGISIETSSALISGITIPSQVPTVNILCKFVISFEPNSSEKFTSQDKSCGVTSHQFFVQTLHKYPFLNVKEPRGIYQGINRLVNTLTKFKIFKL